MNSERQRGILEALLNRSPLLDQIAPNSGIGGLSSLLRQPPINPAPSANPSKLFEYFSAEVEKREIWNKASIIPGQDPSVIRTDVDGRYIRYNEYGQETPYGWEKDHAFPKSLGGLDVLSNLQQRHWLGNRLKGNRFIG